ncbi:unnamed protein product [Calypogeia fissa]
MAVVKALLAFVLLALVMGCAAPPAPPAPPAPKCENIWELKKADFDLAADENKFPGDILIVKTASTSQKFVRGNIWLHFQHDRPRRTIDTIIRGKVVSVALKTFRDTCCDDSKQSCRRGTFQIFPLVTMVVQHLEGPSCTTKLDVERAKVEMEAFVKSCNTMMGHGGFTSRVTVPGGGLAAQDSHVVQRDGSLQLTIIGVVGRANLKDEKVLSCVQNILLFCCSEPHNCHMGFCMSRDPAVDRTIGKVEISLNPNPTVLGKRSKPNS